MREDTQEFLLSLTRHHDGGLFSRAGQAAHDAEARLVYHIEPDGTIPCTNCGQEIEPYNTLTDSFVHVVSRQMICFMEPYEGQVACPEPRNDDGLEYDEHTGRAIA